MFYMMDPSSFRHHYRAATNSYRHKGHFTMTVNGSGTVSVKPDEALLNVGVVTEHMQIQTAQEENSQKSNQLLESLKEIGIEENDITSIVYSINPKYDFVEGQSIFRGYEVEHLFQIKVRDLSKIPTIYRVVIENGANRTSNLQFRLSNPDFHYQEALKMAIQNAKEKAKEISRTIGVTYLKTPIKLTEQTIQQIQPFSRDTYQIAVSTEAFAPPIQSGEITIAAQIKAVFQYTD